MGPAAVRRHRPHPVAAVGACRRSMGPFAPGSRLWPVLPCKDVALHRARAFAGRRSRPPRGRFLSADLARLERCGHSLPGGRNLLARVLHGHPPLDQGPRPVHPPRGLRAHRAAYAAARLAHRADPSALAGQGVRRPRVHRPDLQFGQRRDAGGQALVPRQLPRRDPGRAGAHRQRGGQPAVQGLHHGARALRRRRHRPPAGGQCAAA